MQSFEWVNYGLSVWAVGSQKNFLLYQKSKFEDYQYVSFEFENNYKQYIIPLNTFWRQLSQTINNNKVDIDFVSNEICKFYLIRN